MKEIRYHGDVDVTLDGGRVAIRCERVTMLMDPDEAREVASEMLRLLGVAPLATGAEILAEAATMPAGVLRALDAMIEDRVPHPARKRRRRVVKGAA